jgi:pseudomonalisin
VGRSVLAIQDVVDFQSFFGIGGGLPRTIQNGPPPASDDFGEQVEATLDVTWAGAIALGAAVEYVTSASTNSTDGVDLSELYIVDSNLADVMTESFGACEAAYLNLTAQATAIASLAEQAAAQGITYVVAAGDAGAEGCDDFNTETSARGPLSVNALASTPFTVAVGGTMFNEAATTASTGARRRLWQRQRFHTSQKTYGMRAARLRDVGRMPTFSREEV